MVVIDLVMWETADQFLLPVSCPLVDGNSAEGIHWRGKGNVLLNSDLFWLTEDQCWPEESPENFSLERKLEVFKTRLDTCQGWSRFT